MYHHFLVDLLTLAGSNKTIIKGSSRLFTRRSMKDEIFGLVFVNLRWVQPKWNGTYMVD